MFKTVIKYLVIPFSILFIPFLSQGADLEPLTVRDFSCGLVTTYDPTMIGNGCAQQGWNVDVWTGRLQKRRGSLLQNSSPLTGNQAVRFLKEFPDQSGNRWLVSVSSNGLFASNNSGASNTIYTSTHGISSTSEFQATNAYGKIRLVDGSTNSILFNGSSISVSTATPRGTLINFQFERVMVGNVSGDNSTLYLSRYGEPEDWTDDGVSDNDAIQIPIRKNDGYPIRALVSYGNETLIFKDRSIDAMTMDNSGLVPIITSISNNIGTTHPKSIQVRYNDVIFMGQDGFYSLLGNTLTNISQSIKPTFDSVLQRNSASNSFTETTQTDFQSGTAQGLSVSISPNSLVLSTAQFVDNTTAQFIQGTLNSNLSTTSIAGSIILSGAFENFLDGDYTNNPTWTLSGTAPTISGGVARWVDGTGTALLQTTVAVVPGEVVFFDAGGVDEGSGYFRVILSTYATTSADITKLYTSYSGNTIVWDIAFGDSWLSVVGTDQFANIFNVPQDVGDMRCALSLFTSSITFAAAANNGTVYDNSMSHTTSAIYNYLSIVRTNGLSTAELHFSNIFITTGQVTSSDGYGKFAYYIPSSSTFLSRSSTLTASGVWYGTATFNAVLNTSTATFAVYGDSNTTMSLTTNSSWVSSSTIVQTMNNFSTGTYSISGSSFIAYSVNLVRSSTAAPFSLIYPAFTNAQLDLRYSSGTYLGQNISLNNISAFGVFNENHNLNSGTLSFNIYADSNSTITPSNPATFISSQAVVNNQVPSISTAAFGRVLVTASITDYSQNPQLLDYTVNWLQGSANFPVASLFYEGDYLCAVSTSNTSHNDTILVYDRNNHWGLPYTGLNFYSMAVYNQQAYGGDATAGNIYRFQVDNLYADNSSAISSYWKSKEFDYGYIVTDKTMQKYCLTAKYNSSSSISFGYGVNRGTTTSSSLSLSLTSGFFRKVILPSSLTYQRGITHSFNFSNSTVNQYFDILGVEMWPRLETPPAQ